MADDRKKFESKFRFVDKRRRQQLLSIGGAHLTEDQLMVLEDHLHLSLRRRSNSLPLLHLQLKMLQDLAMVEKLVSLGKKEKEQLQAKLTEPSGQKETLQLQLKRIEREIYVQEVIRRCIRDIGDGIAWRLFDYDRAILTELADRPSGKSINMEGIEPELLEFISLFHSQQGIAVLNDLTHFLKLGDITLRKDTGIFELIEVKGGRSLGGRITRQKQDMRRTTAFFNSGQKEKNGVRHVISTVDIVPQTLHSNIANLLAKAERDGAATDKIGDYLIVECTDFLKAHEIGLDKAKVIVSEAYENVDALVRKDELVLDFASHDRYVNVRNSAPLSIFPFPELSRIKVITGAMLLNSFVNISAVLRYFEQREWKVVKGPEECVKEFDLSSPHKEPIIAQIKKGRLSIHVPFVLLARIGYEFLKPRTLVDMFEAMSEMDPTEERAWRFINLLGEPEIWD